MTDQVNLSEEDIFAAASADAVEDISTQPTPAAAQPQPIEDDPSEEASAAPSTPTQEHRVPVKELQEERQKRQEAMRRADELAERLARLEGAFSATQPRAPQQPQPQAPDFFEDPSGFVNHAVQPLAQQQQEMREQFSQMLAIRDHGQDKVQAAYAEMAQAIKSDPQTRFDYQRIMASPHPYDELVKWHGRKQALNEIGEDPAAYRERLKQELLAELQASSPAPAAAASTAPNPASIPSLTRATGSAGAVEGVITEQDIFNAAPKFKSRRA